MAILLETAKAFFTQERWAFDAAKDAAVLRLGFEGKAGRWRCFLEAKEPVAQLVFFSVRDGAVPDGRRAAVAELLMRLNCRLNVGNFELNFDDGLVRFRTGLDVEGVAPVAPLLRGLTLLNVATMDKYLPAIEQVVRGEHPVKALAAAD
ncbi:MAG: YbjN domain-containing protein [Myxococcaceae bacterium]|nr:YbjN domain-containing protein [Myxococcaceae bacterium]